MLMARKSTAEIWLEYNAVRVVLELQDLAYPVFFEPLSFLARRMDNPRIEELVLAIRTRLGNKQIDKTNSAAPILRILRNGGTVGVLADVNAHPKEGVFVPFFDI